jgi:hypothetical protein
MSNVILNSNSNSALVNTMNASSSVFNPQVYSTKRIIPAHSMTYSKHQPSNGSTPVAGQTTNFTLNKYGIIAQVLLSYTKRVDITTELSADTRIEAGDVFRVLEKVELMSSSRTVSTLTRFDLISQFSDLPQDKLFPVERSCLNQSSLIPKEVGVTDVDYTVPMVFGFMRDINTQLNASFLETLSIKCTWGRELTKLLYPTTADRALVTVTVINPTLQVRYKAYPEDANAKIIAENFDKPTLNMLSTKYYNENKETKDIVVTGQGRLGVPQAQTDIKVELKSTECVQCFYVILTKTDDFNSSANAPGPNQSFVSQPIDSIKFTGSGAEILELTGKELDYMKLSPDGYSWGQDGTSNGAGLTNVYKIQTGVYDSYEMPNCFSLREINAPQMEVKFRPVPTNHTTGNLVQYSVHIAEDCSTIYSIASATGSLNNSLSN